MKTILEQYIKIFHTLKYLKFEQFYFRALYKFKRPKVAAELVITNSNQWIWEGPSLFKQSIFPKNEVFFLNKSGAINEKADWNHPSYEKLWLYNLHYFDDLSSITFQEREKIHYAFINKWIDDNPPCVGNGWEPYPLSLRLVNWVKWFSKKDIVDKKYLSSIAQQATALTQQLEYHILGNHLFANAKALTFVGAYLKGKEGEKFLLLGLKLLDRELKEQFLSDGAHFELSPMYHEILLWDLLELIDLAKVSKNSYLLLRLENWMSLAKKALEWLASMIHPDGEISFFNDAAIGIAAAPKDIFSYAKKLGIQNSSNGEVLVTNQQSGYSRIQYDDYTLIFDHANVGPDYLPGHAHADNLSFELSVGLQRVFVNSGTSLYGVSNERLRQRETAAHNTLVVCDSSSSEVWSGFRVARRAYSTLIKANSDNAGVVLSARHNGYERLNPKVTHTRTIQASNKTCIITDKLSNKSCAEFNLHIHPNVDVHIINDKVLDLHIKTGIKLRLISSENLELKTSTWHPEFGKTVDNKKVIIPFTGDELVTKIEFIRQ